MSSSASTSPTPPALYPHGPPFEPIQTTLTRHLHYLRTSKFNSSPPCPSKSAVFASLHQELWSALSILRLDMCCATCMDQDIKYNRHVADDLYDELEKLSKAIRDLKQWDWMDQNKLKIIGEGFDWLRRTHKARWRKSPCAMGLWKNVEPEVPNLTCQLAEGVRYDLTPFGQGSFVVARRAEALLQEWMENQATEIKD